MKEFKKKYEEEEEEDDDDVNDEDDYDNDEEDNEDDENIDENDDEDNDEIEDDDDDYDNGNDIGDGDDDKYDDDEYDDDEYDENKESMILNPTSVRDRIDDCLETLANFKTRKNKSISRSEIIQNLLKYLSEYYGYIPDLAELILDLFSPAECVEFMDASDRPRPMVIRTNTLKTTRKDLVAALMKRGAQVEPIDWSKVAIKVTESSIPIGATPEYLAGHYMLQAASSMCPVMALAPQPGERVLDMAAAPGGKTSYIAQLMKNSGTIIVNDAKEQRQKATVANLHRMGVKNSIVCCYDGRKIPGIMKGFDRVLLDAPCSGTGVISRDQTVKLQRTVKDIQRIAHLQKELLIAAVDAVDPKSPSGGIVVYSTCSISTEENEQVVNYILQKRFVRLIDTGLEVGNPGFTRHKERRFHPSLALTKRFYPHVHNMDGFYVAKFQKYANGVKGSEEKEINQDEDDMDVDEGDDDDDDDDDDNDDDTEKLDEEDEDDEEEEEDNEEDDDNDEVDDHKNIPSKSSGAKQVKFIPTKINSTNASKEAAVAPVNKTSNKNSKGFKEIDEDEELDEKAEDINDDMDALISGFDKPMKKRRLSLTKLRLINIEMKNKK